ncbi:MAG: ferritin-like domain-containing protein, partial [Candidatus Binatia bacterium]
MPDSSVDPAFNTVSRNDFDSMMNGERYARRSSDFDEIISRTNEHFWDPVDPDYIDYSEAWSFEEPIFPLDFIVELQSAVADRLDDRQKVILANES